MPEDCHIIILFYMVGHILRFTSYVSGMCMSSDCWKLKLLAGSSIQKVWVLSQIKLHLRLDILADLTQFLYVKLVLER